MAETMELIALIAVEKCGTPEIILGIFFLIFCYGVAEIFNVSGNENKNDSSSLLIGFIGLAVMLNYLYNSYDLSNHDTRTQWITYFNLKSL